MGETDQPVWESEFDNDYREMAQDEARESEALELAEATIGDLEKKRGESSEALRVVQGGVPGYDQTKN